MSSLSQDESAEFSLLVSTGMWASWPIKYSVSYTAGSQWV